MLSSEVLTKENFKKGALVSESLLVAVVEQSNGTFAVFSTELESGETDHLSVWQSLDEALFKAHALVPLAHFEAFGCNKGSACVGGRQGNCESCHSNGSC